MLLFYDFGFNMLLAENRVISTDWTLYYNDIGTFEAHLPIDSEVLNVLSQNSYVVAREGTKTAIIIGYEAENEIVIYGRTPNWILTKRIAPTMELTEEKPNIICKNLLETEFSDVTNFEILPFTYNQNVSIERNVMETVFSAVSDCLAIKNLGHSLDFDTSNNKWVFKFLKENENDILISEANKNAYELTISEDMLDVANAGYFGEDGYISGTETGIYKWETILDGETESEAQIELEKKKKNSKVTLKLKNLSFEKDYNLGDILRIQIIKGKVRTTVRRRISGVNIHTKNGYLIECPIFEEIGGIE